MTRVARASTGARLLGAQLLLLAGANHEEPAFESTLVLAAAVAALQCGHPG